MRIGSLFTGFGGLDMAVEAFFDADTAWTCDIDPGASKILAHRYPHAPNLGDITAINWGQVEPVDILAGGWPCQPFSLAGKRKGADDERALWPEVARAVRALRPRHVVLENVAAIAAAGELSRAVADLAALGYVGQWRCLRAANIGAPHGRARIFILAANTGHGRVADGTWETRREGDQWSPIGAEPRSGRDTPADANLIGHQRSRDTRNRRSGSPNNSGTPTDPDSDGRARIRGQLAERCDPDRCSGQNTAWGKYEPAIRRWERILGRLAPPPTEPGPKGAQPDFVNLHQRRRSWLTSMEPVTVPSSLTIPMILSPLELCGAPIARVSHSRCRFPGSPPPSEQAGRL